jgi:NADH-quinone oxidoreductase subunit L
MSLTTLFALVLLGLPALGALLLGVAGLSNESWRHHRTIFGTLATTAVTIPFFASLYLGWVVFQSGGFTAHFGTFLEAGQWSVDLAYLIDPLSITMALVITGIGTLIHIYSIGYMKHDAGAWRFFAYLNLFIFAMLQLVMADNLLVLFIGWEGVGLASYLLIGFWFKKPSNTDAANKAFIFNRIGDFAFLVAMFLLLKDIGTLQFSGILEGVSGMSQDTLFWVGLLMLIGATGKSAQFPLFVWLPDAMAGPTPVSALIHAATMVTSGLYLVTRLSPMFVLSPEVMMIMAVVGAFTALIAATIAMTQYDIKKVLAYSTVSQLGFMFLALGSGAFVAAIFHVITHAFFKALLFLGSGSVIHTMEHAIENHDAVQDAKTPSHLDPQDIRLMGGLRHAMPITFRTFWIGTLAIAGIPPLAGFFSKDEILMHTFNAGMGEFAGPLYIVLWVVGMVTAFMTAFYMVRLTATTFHGESRLEAQLPGASKSFHESPRTMTFPLWKLAIGSIIIGWIGLPNFVVESFTGQEAHIHLLKEWIYTQAADMKVTLSYLTEWILMSVSIVVAILGVSTGWRLYGQGQWEATDQALQTQLGEFYNTCREKYLLDEFYQRMVGHPVRWVCKHILEPIDRFGVGGVVAFFGVTTRVSGGVLRILQAGLITNYAVFILLGVIFVLALMILGPSIGGTP